MPAQLPVSLLLLYIPIASCITHTCTALSKAKAATHPVSIAPACFVSKEIKYTRWKQWHHSARVRMSTGQTLLRSFMKTEVAACFILKIPRYTLRTPPAANLCMKVISIKKKKILMFESPYFLWLRRAEQSISNQELSLTLSRSDVNTCALLQRGYITFRELDKFLETVWVLTALEAGLF